MRLYFRKCLLLNLLLLLPIFQSGCQELLNQSLEPGKGGLKPSTSQGAVGGTETGNPSSPEKVGSFGLGTGKVDEESIGQSLSDSVDVLNGIFNIEGNAEPDLSVLVSRECLESAHTASSIKFFGRYHHLSDGSVLLGKKRNQWVRMGAGACDVSQPSSSPPSFMAAIQGNGARQLFSTGDVFVEDVCGSSNEKLTRTFLDGSWLEKRGCAFIDYSGFKAETVWNRMKKIVVKELVHMDETVSRYNHDGNLVSEGMFSTRSPLVVSWSKLDTMLGALRQILSGELSVIYPEEDYTMKFSFDHVEYDYNFCACHPVRGAVTTVIESISNGSQVGVGSITFTHDQTGKCGTVSATLDGHPLEISLSPCY